MKRILCKVITTLFFVLLINSSVVVEAKTQNKTLPYYTYIYDNYGDPVEIPAVYTVESTYSGEDCSTSNYDYIADIFVGENDKIFVCDCENNRVVVLNMQYQALYEISDFQTPDGTDSFNKPYGVFVDENYIYVADSENSRIVVFDVDDYTFQRSFNRPEISILGDNYNYTPLKVVVDNAGRIYVVAKGVNQGLVCLDENGKFMSFLGAPKVEPEWNEILWRKIATKEQKKAMQSYVPTEYDALYIDKNGFIYVVSHSSAQIPVGKINSAGDDVLKELKNEVMYGDSLYTGKSPYFIDVTVDKEGNYFVLDSQQGKIYGYTSDGYLMYIFGTNGSQRGTFYNATAIDLVGERLVVTDSTKNTITVFELTSFGKNIHKGLSQYKEGLYKEAEDSWNQVLSKSSGYVLATVQNAKIKIQDGDYLSAMKMLKDVHERDCYSIAFGKARDSYIKENFTVFCMLIVILVMVGILLSKIKVKFSARKSSLYNEYKYANHISFHPIDGFWDLKREGFGSMKAGFLLLAIFCLTYAIKVQFSGYLVSYENYGKTNALYELGLVLFPLACFVISNWCFTTLMDGKGTMKDIIKATCYSLKPYIVCNIVLLVLSNVLTIDELVYFDIVNTLCVIWTLGLLFFNIMLTHDYSLSKTILTVILILVGICIILFILLLFVDVVSEFISYVYEIYQELIFRTY